MDLVPGSHFILLRSFPSSLLFPLSGSLTLICRNRVLPGGASPLLFLLVDTGLDSGVYTLVRKEDGFRLIWVSSFSRRSLRKGGGFQIRRCLAVPRRRLASSSPALRRPTLASPRLYFSSNSLERGNPNPISVVAFDPCPYFGTQAAASSSDLPDAYSPSNGEYAPVDWNNLGFGLMQTDYMYSVKCGKDDEFKQGRMLPYGNLELSPSAGVLNYGQGLFEGTKAHRRDDGGIILFRPRENALRMQFGADRMCMPSPSVSQFVDSVRQTALANRRSPMRIHSFFLY